MDRPQWPQEIVVKPMEEIVTNSSNLNNIPSKPSSSSSSFERRVIRSSSSQKAAPHVNCPRCDSTNTKFCYYNNYSLSQPRYFCKTCRRYWTEGGTLRNIPVGGGSRKNKRSSSSSSSSHSSVSNKQLNHSDHLFVPPASTSVLSQNPRIHHHHQGHYGHYYGQDLNLSFPSSTSSSTSTTTGSAQLSAMELLNGITTTRGGTATTTTTSSRRNSFMPIPIPIADPNSVYSASMIPMMPEFKIPSSLGFSLDGMAASGGYGNSSTTTVGGGGGILFPFEEEVKTNTQSTTHEDDVGQTRDHHQNGDSNGFWNGMLGGGSW